MDEPVLSPEERQALNGGSWFASLSPSLRHDLVRHGTVRRFADKEPVFLRGQDSTCWAAVVRGNVRVSTSHPGGKQLTLCYMRPGLWFCDVSVLHDEPRSYDAHAHGPAAMLMVSLEHAQGMLRQHQELYGALLRLHAARTRQLFELLQDLQTLSLRERIAKQFTQLARRYGVPSLRQPTDIRIGLQFGQEELAQLVSASRQRVNRELQEMRAEGLLGMEQGRWVVRNLAGMQRVAGGEPVRAAATHPANATRSAALPAAAAPYALAAA
ncbi:MAG TPA: Crp/Fnr family transcriptional regulator [Ramlibacter sp.]|nr:Crp/Fnr family transcriptional regulator [Ramlibacter sp.]